MPSARISTSPALAALLKSGRERRGYRLRDVESLTREAGSVIPFSTLARIENGALDPGAKRLHLLLHLYNLSPSSAADLLDLERFAGDIPTEKDPKKLYEMGRSAWNSGDARGGLGAFIALQQRADKMEPLLRQKAFLGLSTAASQVGKFHYARQVAEDLLLEPPHPSILVSVMVQVAQCWHRLGSNEIALAVLDRAATHLNRKSPPLHEAWLFHEKSCVLYELKDFKSAEAALERALRAYRRAKDEFGYCSALAVRVRASFARGDAASALRAAETARLYAERHRLRRLRMLRRIDEGRAHVSLGQAQRGIAHIGEALADAIATNDPMGRFYAHYYLWKAYESTEDTSQAAVEYQAAASFVKRIDEVSPETTEVRELLLKKGGRGKRRSIPG